MVLVMNATTQRVCAWSGPLLLVFFGLGFLVVAGLIPPPLPNASAEEIRQMYIEGGTQLRIGLVITLVASGFAYPWTVGLAVQMQRIEGRWSPMALSQLAAGVVLPLLFAFPIIAWSAASYRAAQRSAEVTQLANDLGWLGFVGIGAPAIVQSLAIAIVVFRDPRHEPVFPRWVGYFNLWCALLFVPGALVICFHDGPFAWNGLFAFWIPLVLFTAWFVVMTVVLLRAISGQESEADPRSGTVEDLDFNSRREVERLSDELAALRKQISESSSL
jgi:hypothetical protein